MMNLLIQATGIQRRKSKSWVSVYLTTSFQLHWLYNVEF